MKADEDNALPSLSLVTDQIQISRQRSVDKEDI